MEPIEFSNSNNPDHEAQLTYLIKREFYVTYYRLRKYPYYLIAITIIILALLQFTPSDNLIILKSVSIVMLILVWFFTLIFLTTVLIKWYRRNQWKKECLKLTTQKDAIYSFYFDEEKLQFHHATYKTELNWDYYKYWSENKESIFIFPATNIYEAIYYSVSDLGIENYSLLKGIVSSKLTKLSE